MVYAQGPGQLHLDGITADSFGELAEIAMGAVGNARELSMVCGPITTGGTNHQMLNLKIFNATIRGLESRGVRLFNQVPYEYGLRRLIHKWEDAGNTGYCMEILEIFYERLFRARVITKGWFIPGWISSVGARWERNWLKNNGGSVHDFTHAEIEAFLNKEHTPDQVREIMSLMPR